MISYNLELNPNFHNFIIDIFTHIATLSFFTNKFSSFKYLKYIYWADIGLHCNMLHCILVSSIFKQTNLVNLSQSKFLLFEQFSFTSSFSIMSKGWFHLWHAVYYPLSTHTNILNNAELSWHINSLTFKYKCNTVIFNCWCDL